VVDSHCHLADETFASDLDAVVGRARDAGVEAALVILEAGHVGEAAQGRRVEALWPEVRFAVGVHPHHAGRYDDGARAVEVVRGQLAASPSARAVGEIGLDYHYDFAPPEAQRAVFRAQLRLARELGLPVVLHTREAETDTVAILREESGGGTLRGVVHCFTGSDALAEAALDLGFFISLAGIVTFPKAAPLRDTARRVPADRLLTETDSPFLAPVPHRGKRNEPALVARVVDALAEARGASPAALAQQTADNFRALFRP
jgi:TatD DNase family protein